jgi:hypothetical protein
VSVLRIQTLYLTNCAMMVEREYFGWGWGQPGDSPEPSWERASPEPTRHFQLHPQGITSEVSQERHHAPGRVRQRSATVARNGMC